MKLLDINLRVEYVLRDERDDKGKPKKGATVWYLRCLRQSEIGTLDDSMMDFSQSAIEPVTDERGNVTSARVRRPALDLSGRVRNRVRLGICGWENLTDAQGKPVEFTPTPFQVGARTMSGVPEAVIDAMPSAVLRELHDEIESLSTVRPDEGN